MTFEAPKFKYDLDAGAASPRARSGSPSSSVSQAKKDMRGRTMSLSVDWDKIFGTDAKVHKTLHHGFDVIEKDMTTFLTGSTYKGGWNLIGMANFGTYTLPHQVEYEGHLMDGQFNGEGLLSYPMGQKTEGIWEKDKLVDFKFIFTDGLIYEEPWEYCIMPDRRFYVEIQEGLKPGGQEFRTNDDIPRVIPEGCYDTGDGFYNPKTKCIQSPDDPNKVLRIASLGEEQWIIDNCRKAWDEATGYRPDLYERWCTGRMEERYQTDSYSSEEFEDENGTPDSEEIGDHYYDDHDFFDHLEEEEYWSDGPRNTETRSHADSRRNSEAGRTSEGRRNSEAGRTSEGRRNSEVGRTSEGRRNSEAGRTSEGRRNSEAGRTSEGRRTSDVGRHSESRRNSESRRTSDAFKGVQIPRQSTGSKRTSFAEKPAVVIESKASKTLTAERPKETEDENIPLERKDSVELIRKSSSRGGSKSSM